MAQIIGGNFAGTGSIVPAGGGLGMQVDPNNPTALMKTPAMGNDTYTGAPLNPPPSAPKEPAIVSSQGADEQIKNAQAKMADMSQKGTQVDTKTGATTYADGSTVPAVEGATYNAKTGQYEPTDKTAGDYGAFYGSDTTAPSPEYQAIEAQFAPLKASLDASTLGQVNAIQQQYENLKTLQKTVNDSTAKSTAFASNVNGTSRYAPLDAHGIALANLSTGLSKISDLDAQENAAIAKANNAGQAGDDKLMTQMMSQAETIRKEKQTQADKVMTGIQKANDALQTTRDQLQKDDAVAQMMGKGETDPATIMKAINDAGINITADEVKKSMTALTPASTPADNYKFTQANTGKLLASGMSTEQIKQTQDYYNGKGDAPQLDAKQTAAVQEVLSGITPKSPAAPKGTKPMVSGTLTYTAEDHAADSKALDASRGQDGYVDPGIYQKLYTAWVGKGGSLEDFVKTYPPKNYVNPANDWLPSYLQPPKKASTTAGISAAEINALFAK